jgi:saccharopine dehydrogenase-like NADP-dependent oxidoreductase
MGGTGVFGKRLARHLATFPEVEIFVSSRTQSKAAQVVQALQRACPDARYHAVALDHASTLPETLAQIRPFAVIDCSGPFQTAGYDTARTVLKAGAHLIDLADARDYLAGFADALDATARASHVSAVTGASSTPALSSCVVRQVTAGWQRVDTIDICITPGGKSEVGRSVIAAILSYAGKDVPVWQQGRITTTTGWGSARFVDIPNLGRRRVAAVETFDAEYLGPRHGVTSRVSFAAGLESRIEQWGIEGIAALRKRRLCPDPGFLIPALLQARRITRLPTSDKGGMLVHCTGFGKDGEAANVQWSLIAQNDHGPCIPVLPAAAVLQKLLAGDGAPGAAIADTRLTLPDILAQMAPYDISTLIS